MNSDPDELVVEKDSGELGVTDALDSGRDDGSMQQCQRAGSWPAIRHQGMNSTIFKWTATTLSRQDSTAQRSVSNCNCVADWGSPVVSTTAAHYLGVFSVQKL